MNIYSVDNNEITSTSFDLIEANTSASLIAHTPADKILGIDKTNNDFYYYDGTSWITLSGSLITISGGTSGSSGTNIPSYNLYTDLPVSGVTSGQDAFVQRITSGGMIGPYYFKFLNNLWNPIFTSADLVYIMNNPWPTSGTSGNTSGDTSGSPGMAFLQTRSILMTTPQNAMFMDIEPLESGTTSAIPIISGAGRTICSNFNRMTVAARAQHRIYGIRFLLGNMTTSAISGGAMSVGFSDQWNGLWTPRTSGVDRNLITGNLMTGWQFVTVSGNSALPIPAAEAKPSGITLKTVWTDWVTIPQGWTLSAGDWDFLTRFLLPPRSVAPYALTFANWGGGILNYGTLVGRHQMRKDWRIDENAYTEHHLRIEGDYVRNIYESDITLIAGDAPGGGFPPYSFGSPGPTHSPLLAVHYATSLEEIQ